MRSRYSAYALGKVRYIQDTGEIGRSDHARWAQEIRAFCETVAFDGLEVGAVETGDQESFVTFRAVLSHGSRDVSFTERSRFELHEGSWRYVAGERLNAVEEGTTFE